MSFPLDVPDGNETIIIPIALNVVGCASMIFEKSNLMQSSGELLVLSLAPWFLEMSKIKCVFV